MKALLPAVYRNALANVVRGGANVLVAIAVPPFLAQSLTPERYAAYAILLQAAAYIAYCDFGLHTAIARFVAETNESGDRARRDRVLNAGMVSLAAIAMLAIVAGAGMTFLLPHFYPNANPALIAELRLSLLLLIVPCSLALLGAVSTAILIGLQRSEFATLYVGGSRIVCAAATIVAVRITDSLAVISLVIGVSYLLGACLQFRTARRLTPGWKVSFRSTGGPVRKELFVCCGTLSLWSFAMMMVNGASIFILSYYDFQAVAYYSIASNLVILLAGINNAAFGAFLPATAVLHARSQGRALADLVIRATAVGYWLVLLTALPLLLFGGRLLDLWVGPQYAGRALPILQILILGNAVRLLPNPYSVALIGTGQQRKAFLSPIGEIVANLTVSLAAGALWGAPGVALGVLAGGVAGFAVHIVYNIPRTQEIRMESAQYVRHGLARPIIYSLPLLAATGYGLACSGGTHSGTSIFLIAAGLCASAMMSMRARVFALRPMGSEG